MSEKELAIIHGPCGCDDCIGDTRCVAYFDNEPDIEFIDSAECDEWIVGNSDKYAISDYR